MPTEIVTAVTGLAGALIGGGFSLAGQRTADARARTRTRWSDHRAYVGALRLTLVDLERSVARLERMKTGDPRGYTELPRGAWIEYRGLLAPRWTERY
jgi:hypothetical protein